eukprot:998497_1
MIDTFPIAVDFTNDPVQNQASFTIRTTTWDAFEQRCGFCESFATNAAFQIYISADDIGEYCEFDTFHLEYIYEMDATTTTQPTSSPTRIPSDNTMPLNPTLFPSFLPTISPS